MWISYILCVQMYIIHLNNVFFTSLVIYFWNRVSLSPNSKFMVTAQSTMGQLASLPSPSDKCHISYDVPFFVFKGMC